MTTIYVAFDGRQFQNEADCEFYEWKCAHTLLDRIEFYNKDDIRVFDYFSESAYNAIEKIVIKDEPALHQFHELAEYTGFCSYDDITSIGTWNWDGEKFVKKEEEKKDDTDTNENNEGKNS